MIPITWSSMVWGHDLVGPLKKVAGGYTHLVVAIDKFSKWTEARPITNIRSEQAVLFFTDIIHRFRIPNVTSPTMAHSSLAKSSRTSVIGITSM